HEARSLPGQRVDSDRSAVGLDEALGDGQAQAGAAPRLAGRGRASVEGLEDPGALGGIYAGALVDDPYDDARAALADMHRHRQAARVAQRILEQIRERALEVGGVGADRWYVGLGRDPHVVVGSGHTVSGGENHVLERNPVSARLRVTGLEPRQ